MPAEPEPAYVPGGQSVHEVDPGTPPLVFLPRLEMVPAPQVEQDPAPPIEYEPAAQMRGTVAPSGQ